MILIDARKLFLLLRTHHQMPTKHREADLQGRLFAVASATPPAAFDDLTRKYLGKFLTRRGVFVSYIPRGVGS